MLGALWLENNKIDLHDIPQPRKPGEAPIKIRQVGICSTDLELVKGYYPSKSSGSALMHY